MAECLFCRIAQHSIPATIIAEDDELLAFQDIKPQAPVHWLVIPKVHIASLADVTPAQAALVGRMGMFASQLAKTHGLLPDGFRFVINCGPLAGQTVWHLHGHVLGGRSLQWPPG